MKVSPFAGESRWATLTVFLGCFVPLFASFAIGAHSSSCPTMMRLIFSRLITNCPHEQRQMRMRMRMWQRRLRRHKTTSRRGRGRKTREEEEGKHFGRGPKYLTLQMKWQNVESNAQTAQNVSQRRDAEQGEETTEQQGVGESRGGP